MLGKYTENGFSLELLSMNAGCIWKLEFSFRLVVNRGWLSCFAARFSLDLNTLEAMLGWEPDRERDREGGDRETQKTERKSWWQTVVCVTGLSTQQGLWLNKLPSLFTVIRLQPTHTHTHRVTLKIMCWQSETSNCSKISSLISSVEKGPSRTLCVNVWPLLCVHTHARTHPWGYIENQLIT